MQDRQAVQTAARGIMPFALTVPIGLVGVVASLALGVRSIALGYPGALLAAVVLGAVMGSLMAWRAQSERDGRTLDLGSGWRAPILAAGLSATALVFAPAGERAELTLYSGVLGVFLGLAGTLYTYVVDRRRIARGA